MSSRMVHYNGYPETLSTVGGQTRTDRATENLATEIRLYIRAPLYTKEYDPVFVTSYYQGNKPNLIVTMTG